MNARTKNHVQIASDICLTSQWSGVTHAQLLQLGLGGLPASDRNNVAMIISNVLVAHRVDRWVSYSRNRDYYVGLQRYEGEDFTYRKILRAVECLVDAGFLLHEKSNQGAVGWQSRIRATERLLAAARDWGHMEFAVRELIVLKNSCGKRVPYEDTDETRHARSQLEIFNEALASVTIEAPWVEEGSLSSLVLIDGDVVPLGRRTLYRVYNRNWFSGGRLYGGGWQNLGKARRKALCLDGEPVSEYDYAQLHPLLLYASLNKVLGVDAYTLLGTERSLAKTAWQIMINSTSRRIAEHALVRALREQGAEDPSLSSARTLLNALQKRHAQVASAFYTGVGLGLQFIDAELMTRVLVRCLKANIIGLPVHDSLIVKERDFDMTKQIMDDELQRTLRWLRSRPRH